MECAKRCFDDGILIRSSGDTLVLSPPLIIAENEIEMVFATIRRALDMVALLPDTAERTDRMIFLNLRLGASLLVAEDYADPEVETTFQRCQQLAERAEALPPLLRNTPNGTSLTR